MAEGPLIQREHRDHPPALAPRYKTSLTRAPRLPLLSAPTTITEESGPVFDRETLGTRDNDLILNFTGKPALGERIIVHGRVLDQNARPLEGVLIEVWQANAGGRYRHARDGYLAPLDPDFGGCGRCLTSADGAYAFRTIRPGAYPWPNGVNDWRPSHIHFSLSGPAFGQRLVTQMYFEGDPLIRRCPIANAAPQEAVERLTARLDMARTIPMDATAWAFDIVLRGRRQAMFENRQEGL